MLGPGPLTEDGPGCRGCSEVCGSWCWDPLGREVGNISELIDLDSWVLFCLPLDTGAGPREDTVEGGESDGMNPTTDVGLGLPLVFTPFNGGASFGGVAGGDKVLPSVPRLPTLDGRDGGLTMGAGVADKFLECRFGFSQSVRRRPWPMLSDRPCTPDTATVAVGSRPSPPGRCSGEGRLRRRPSLN